MSLPRAAIKSAREAIDAGAYARCMELCDEGLSVDPTCYLLLVFKGTALAKSGRPQDAVGCFVRASRLQPETALAWQGIVSAFCREHADVFVEAVKELCKLAPEKADELNDRALKTLLDEGLLLEAISFIDHVKSRSTDANIVPLLMKQRDLWARWESESIEEQVRKQRYSLHAGPLPQLRARITKSVYEQSKLESVLCELHDWGVENVIEDLVGRLFAKGQVDRAKEVADKIRPEDAGPRVKQIVADLNDSYEPACYAAFEPKGGSVAALFADTFGAQKQEDYEQVLAVSEKALAAMDSAVFDCSKRRASVLRWRALALAKLGRPEEAASLEVSDNGVLLAIAEAFESSGDYEGALKYAVGVYEPKRLAWLHYRCRQFERAAALADPGDLLLTALLAWQAKRWDDAQELLLGHLHVDEGCAVAFRHLGHYFWRHADDETRAYKCYIKALTLDECDIEAAVGAAEVLLRRDDPVRAVQLLAGFAEAKPLYSRYWKTRGIALMREGREAAQAVKALQNALRGTSLAYNDGSELDSDTVLTSWLGDAYVADGKLQAAYKMYRQSMHLPYSRMSLALTCNRLEQYYEALEHAEHLENPLVRHAVAVEALCGLLQQAIELGTSTEALVGKLQVHVNGELDYASFKALADMQVKLIVCGLRGSLVFEKTIPEGFLCGCDAAYHVAIKLYYASLERATDGVQQARVWTDLSLLYSHAGQAALARDCASKAITGSADKYACLAMSRASAVGGNPAKAQHFACKSLHLDPGFAPAWHLLAALYEQVDGGELRAETLTAACSNCPRDPLIEFSLNSTDYDALRQILALTCSGSTAKHAVSIEEPCPAYHVDIYKAFVDAFVRDSKKHADDEWMLVLVLQRILAMRPQDIESRLLLIEQLKRGELNSLAEYHRGLLAK